MSVPYVIINEVTNRYYIGSTNDIVRRLAEHNRGQTRSTRKFGKWKIIYSEEFETSIEAKRKERKIKSYKSGNAFKKLVRA